MTAELNKPNKNRFLMSIQHTLLVLFTAIFFISCASSTDYTESEQSSTSSYTFYDYKDGEKVQYKVYFNEDAISSLYIDGKKIPEDEISKYETTIYDRLDNVSHSQQEHTFKNDIHVDMSWLNDMLSGMKENLKKNKIRIHFDKENLDKQMEQLREDLEDIDINVEFDKEKFKKEMKELKKHLRKMKDEDFDLNMEEFSEKMQEFAEKMKNQKFVMKDIDIDIPEIHIPHIEIPEVPDIPDIKVDLSALEESMKDLDINMAELDKEMKKLDAFMDDFKKELVKDGIIKNEEESFELDVHKNSLEINGEKVSDELFQKYKKLYKQHFGREFNSHFRINVND